MLALLVPALPADPQKFATEENATKFCKTGNVVWFNPTSKIYFPPGSQFYGKTKEGGYTCRAFAEKEASAPLRGTEGAIRRRPV
jgi:hypothetical protein